MEPKKPQRIGIVYEVRESALKKEIRDAVYRLAKLQFLLEKRKLYSGDVGRAHDEGKLKPSHSRERMTKYNDEFMRIRQDIIDSNNIQEVVLTFRMGVGDKIVVEAFLEDIGPVPK